ncbi:MAG: glutamylcysteine synthetase [Clostridia bacterium]|nr:glutamylcysteine synthetase [Clostridia bacterium]
MNETIVRERLYQRYITPTKKERDKYIGIEIEMPIVNLKREPVDFAVVHEITAVFMQKFGFTVAGIDDEGKVYSAERKETSDILSYDCSYNNLELSLGKRKNLIDICNCFQDYYAFLQEQFRAYGYTLTGMGINPYRQYNHNIPIPNGRYRMLFHHLGSYKNYFDVPMFFHRYPQYGTFSSASQVQLDIDYDDLLTTLSAFSEVEPIKALLFSNSVLLGEHEELLCCRDMFWEHSTHGINAHNVGMFECSLDTIDDLLSYIESTSIYCVERDEKYINFAPVKIMEYFAQESVSGEYYADGAYHSIEVKPEIDDIQYLRTFKFEDLTFRGTVEFRSVCCQPIADCMTVAAFHVGLKNHIYELDHLLKNDHIIYHRGYTAAELRRLFNHREIPPFVDQDALYALAEKVVNLARDGLRMRGLGEEVFLAPLYERLKKRTNPAKHMLDQLEQGVSLEEMILAYGKLESCV